MSTQTRCGTFSASSMYKLLVKPKSKSEEFSQTALTYITQKAMEQHTGIEDEISAAALDWGNENEPQSLHMYEQVFGTTLTQPERVQKGPITGIADGIDGNILIETKSPWNRAIHFENLLLQAEDFPRRRKEYWVQINTYMLLYDLSSARFLSYDPRFPEVTQLAVIELERDNDLCVEIMDASEKAEKKKNEILAKLK
ncbi:MAG: YqaJ viral recombinase family protein [Sphingobacterium sp.]